MAEVLLRDHAEIEARSAGTEEGARVKVTPGLIGWVDSIFVMERRHLERLSQKFGDALADTPVYVLDIADDYVYMDNELIDILMNRIAQYVDL